jgi:hypothetical protein
MRRYRKNASGFVPWLATITLTGVVAEQSVDVVVELHGRLTQELRNHAHRHEQPARSGLAREKAEMAIKAGGALVLGIDNQRHRSNLIGMGQAAMQGIQEQMLSETLALGGLIDGQPARQRDGELRVAGQLARQIVRQVSECQHRGRERVVAEDPCSRRFDGDKRRGDALVGVLSSLLP